jgi:hypothetical protein
MASNYMFFDPTLYQIQRHPEHDLKGKLWLESSKRVFSHRLTDRYEIIQGDVMET